MPFYELLKYFESLDYHILKDPLLLVNRDSLWDRCCMRALHFSTLNRCLSQPVIVKSLHGPEPMLRRILILHALGTATSFNSLEGWLVDRILVHHGYCWRALALIPQVVLRQKWKGVVHCYVRRPQASKLVKVSLTLEGIRVISLQDRHGSGVGRRPIKHIVKAAVMSIRFFDVGVDCANSVLVGGVIRHRRPLSFSHLSGGTAPGYQVMGFVDVLPGLLTHLSLMVVGSQQPSMRSWASRDEIIFVWAPALSEWFGVVGHDHRSLGRGQHGNRLGGIHSLERALV